MVFYTVISVVYFLFVLSLVLIVVLENRQPVKTIAWILVLLFLPVIGLVAYLFFGKNRKREFFMTRACAAQLARRSAVRFYSCGFPELPSEYHQLIKLFRRQSGAFPYSDNNVQMFTMGHDMLDALMRDIQSARRHIHIEFYIIDNDKIGNLVCNALIAKAREGVKVRLVYDDVGCWKVKNRFFQRMKDAGVEVEGFLPVRFPKFTSKVNYRNHRKIVVIDGFIGYIGGMNLAERYFMPTLKNSQPWRDTHLRLTGNAVAGLQRAFLTDWYVASGELIKDKLYYPQEDEHLMRMLSDKEEYVCRKALIQIVTAIPTSTWPDIMQGMIMAVMRAKKYCYLQSPYFMPTEGMLFAMQTAALSGVDVRLMMPAKADSSLLTWASRSYVWEAMKAGVRVYFYNKGFLHAKTLVCDDFLSSCGSTNIDFRSFEHNFEVNAFIYNKEMALKMKSIFLEDQQDCILLNVNNWRHRPFWNRMGESFIRVLSPLL